MWYYSSHLVLPLALGALQPQHQLLGGLGLLPQDRLGLTSESLLLTVVPVRLVLGTVSHTQIRGNRRLRLSPPSALSLLGLGRLLVLSHLEQLVGQAVGTVSLTELRHIHHDGYFF